MSEQGNWYQRGMADGLAWANSTGLTSADLHLVQVPDVRHVPVRRRVNYKVGYRQGVAVIRRQRYLAEQGITPA
jgi:hypothetical protein